MTTTPILEESISQLVDKQLNSDAGVLDDWRSSDPEHGSWDHADRIDERRVLGI